MLNYIEAELQANEPHAVYEDVIYDRYLTINADNHTLKLFDLDNISSQLNVGEKYRFIVHSLIGAGVKYATISELTITQNVLTGQVLATNIRFEQGCCGISSPNLFYENWLLLSTLYGNVLVSQALAMRILGVSEIQIGEYLTWDSLRLDFYGVV